MKRLYIGAMLALLGGSITSSHILVGADDETQQVSHLDLLTAVGTQCVRNSTQVVADLEEQQVLENTIEHSATRCGTPTIITQSMIPYTISSPGVYCLAEDVTVGAGQTGITISANNVILDLNEHQIISGGTAIELSASYVAIKNGLVREQSAAPVLLLGASYCTINGLVVNNASAAGSAAIYLNGSSSYIDIKNCTFNEGATVSSNGIYAAYDGGTMVGITVKDCEFNNTSYGILAECVINQWKILNCSFQHCNQDAVMISPLFGIVSEISIHDCIVHNSNAGGNGISVIVSPGTGAAGIDIQRMVIKNVGSNGIYIHAASEVLIKGCTITSAGERGINITNAANGIVVEGCEIASNTLHGIAVDGLNVAIQDCKLIKNMNNGLDLASTASGVVISHCEIMGNSGSGIVNDGQTQIIVGNSIVNNGEHGINCTTSSAKTYIHNNIVVTNGGIGILNTSAMSTNTIYRNFANRNNGGNYSGVNFTNSPGGALAGNFDDFIANVSN